MAQFHGDPNRNAEIGFFDRSRPRKLFIKLLFPEAARES